MLDEKVWMRRYSPYTGATEEVLTPIVEVLSKPEAYLMPDVIKLLSRVSRYLLLHSEQLDLREQQKEVQS